MKQAHTLKNLPLLTAALLALLPAGLGFAADAPKVIRIGFPSVGTGNRPLAGGGPLATVQLQGSLEEEFKPDGIKIEWSFFRQAGPAINESFANNLLDFASEGDLAMIIGRAGGLKTRLLAGGGQGQPVAVAVPLDSPIKSLADLKGKKVVIAKGTALQLAAARVFAKIGLSEKDVRVINIVGPGATDVLATRDADAVFGIPSQFYPLRDRGIARLLYESTDPEQQIVGGVIGNEEFIRRYPQITRRIIKVVVRTAAYTSDERNRNALFKLWGQDGTGFGYYKESYVDKQTNRPIPLVARQTPLLDEFWIDRIKVGVADSLKFHLIRTGVDVDGWVERSFLDAALKDLNLEKQWVRYGADGKPIDQPKLLAQ